jgi:uncharacterized membrane protein
MAKKIAAQLQPQISSQEIEKAAATSLRWAAPLLFGCYFLGGIAPPVLAAVGLARAGEIVTRIYSHTCHQLADHSFAVSGIQFAFCARCTGFYGAIFLVTLLINLKPKTLPLPQYWAGALMLPVLVDVAFDLAGLTPIANLIRFSLGCVGAGALAWLLYPRFISAIRR